MNNQRLGFTQLRLRKESEHTQASESVDTINVHRTATADTLSATSPESQGGVDLVLDTDERIEHHGTGLVQIQLIGLHLGLLGGSIGVPAVDLELLDARLLGGGGFLHGRRLRLGGDTGSGMASCAHLGHGINGRIRAGEDSWAEEGLGSREKARSRAEGRHGGRSFNFKPEGWKIGRRKMG